MAYDSQRGQTVLFGGVRWQQLTAAQGTPGAHRAPALTYDSARSQLVVFDGVSSWEYGR